MLRDRQLSSKKRSSSNRLGLRLGSVRLRSWALDLRFSRAFDAGLAPRPPPGPSPPHAHALGITRRRRTRRPRTGRILRRCLGSIRCWRRSLWWCCSAEMFRSYSLPAKYLFVVPEIFVVLAVVGSSWVEIRVRARVTAGCWSCVEICTSTSIQQSSYSIKYMSLPSCDI